MVLHCAKYRYIIKCLCLARYKIMPPKLQMQFFFKRYFSKRKNVQADWQKRHRKKQNNLNWLEEHDQQNYPARCIMNFSMLTTTRVRRRITQTHALSLCQLSNSQNAAQFIPLVSTITNTLNKKKKKKERQYEVTNTKRNSLSSKHGTTLTFLKYTSRCAACWSGRHFFFT